jgi:Resolvase, N terminal domain
MKRTYSVSVQEEVVNIFSGPRLDRTKKLIVYGRQSKKFQIVDNKEAYEQQTVRLLEYGTELGWIEDAIILCYENKRQDGKWRNASATLRIDQRPGLSSVVESIKSEEVKTVLTWAVDRLFRDPDMIQPAVFAKICKDHKVIVITIDDYFDFNHPKRDDLTRFLETAKAAADYITKHLKGRMMPARFQVSRRGEYDGRIVPLGFIVLEENNKYQVYEPHAEILRYIFKRFRELDGALNLLWGEIYARGNLFPPYPKGMGIRGARKERFEGPFGITYQGLRDILTNPAYIGWWYFRQKDKAPLIIKNNHSVIVDEKDFWFAFNTLSNTTITGEPNEMRYRFPTRFTRVGTEPSQALLDGIIKSEPHPIYVFQVAQTPESAAYIIRELNDRSMYRYQASIAVKVLDKIFVEKLMYHLRLLQAIEAVADKTHSYKSREESIFAYIKSMQARTNQELVSIDDQVAEVKQQIAQWQRSRRIAQEEGYEEGEREAVRELKNKNAILSQLEEKKGKEVTDEKLRKAASLILNASEQYDGMTYEQKQSLVRHITAHVKLTEITNSWFLLAIEWSPFLGISYKDIAYIWREGFSKNNWTKEEENTLRSFYPHIDADRDTIMKSLPDRGWYAIQRKAQRLGLSKQHPRDNHLYNNTSLPPNLSYSDLRFMEEKGLECTESKLEERVWWRTAPIEKNESSRVAI